LCPGPDALCLTIRHPLSYYRKKVRAEGPRASSSYEQKAPPRGA